LIWSDRSQRFSPYDLSSFYAELGFFLEFSSLTPKHFYDLTFVSCHPCMASYRGLNVLSYTYDSDRMLNKANSFKSVNARDKIAKLSSFAQLCFNNKDLYHTFRHSMLALFQAAVLRDELPAWDADCLGFIASCSEERMVNVYLGLD